MFSPQPKIQKLYTAMPAISLRVDHFEVLKMRHMLSNPIPRRSSYESSEPANREMLCLYPAPRMILTATRMPDRTSLANAVFLPLMI
jgi:hypothetical protein